jgi:hypothetical protein
LFFVELSLIELLKLPARHIESKSNNLIIMLHLKSFNLMLASEIRNVANVAEYAMIAEYVGGMLR